MDDLKDAAATISDYLGEGVGASGIMQDSSIVNVRLPITIGSPTAFPIKNVLIDPRMTGGITTVYRNDATTHRTWTDIYNLASHCVKYRIAKAKVFLPSSSFQFSIIIGNEAGPVNTISTELTLSAELALVPTRQTHVEPAEPSAVEFPKLLLIPGIANLNMFTMNLELAYQMYVKDVPATYQHQTGVAGFKDIFSKISNISTKVVNTASVAFGVVKNFAENKYPGVIAQVGSIISNTQQVAAGNWYGGLSGLLDNARTLIKPVLGDPSKFVNVESSLGATVSEVVLKYTPQTDANPNINEQRTKRLDLTVETVPGHPNTTALESGRGVRRS